MSITEVIEAHVQRALWHGYGDTSAPLAVGEYVRERRHCPHDGCTWELDTEWWDGSGPTRYRGHINIDRECQAHLETHLPPL